ncbi:MAG: sensor histidine kinase [Burkholderiales bacterium]
MNTIANNPRGLSGEALPETPLNCEDNLKLAAHMHKTKAAHDRAQAHFLLDFEGAHFHPLEAITFFRRWPRSFLRNVLYTVIFNALFAIAFTLLAFADGRPIPMELAGKILVNNLIISNAIGFMFWGVLSLIGPVMRLVNRRSFVEIVLFYSVMGTGIVTLSFVGLSQLLGFNEMQAWILTKRQLLTSFVISFIISLVLAFIWRRRVTELAGQIELSEERERAASAERAATEANLRALQAQIEPHFLFNTLANVTSLIHTRPDDAKHMLEEFIAYLRSSLATTRESRTSLAQEFALMKSFLAVLQIRMGARLKTRFVLDDDVSGFGLPPMLIQPIVENAIKHGLEPKVEGGELVLSARRVADMVEIDIADTGLGFQNTTSSGIGLKNVRERLGKLYGGNARLDIHDNVPSGTKITILLPAAA